MSTLDPLYHTNPLYFYYFSFWSFKTRIHNVSLSFAHPRFEQFNRNFTMLLGLTGRYSRISIGAHDRGIVADRSR